MLIQEKLSKLQEWATTGIRLVELPTVEEHGTEESELALLQYCYYRLIHHVAGNIIENPNYDVHELVDVFHSSPFGGCVSKECVVSLCELLMTSELRCYFRGTLFAPYWTAGDVAGTIHSNNGGTEDLLKAAIEERKSFQSSPNVKTSQNMITQQYSIDALKNNPIFQLSLASKELFHSNFLVWLAEDPNTRDIFSSVLELFGFIPSDAKHISDGLRGCDPQYMALREYKNFDFCICEKVKNPGHTEDEFVPGQIILLLENKFKSIPYEAQLRKYQDLSVKANKEGVNNSAKAIYVQNHNGKIPNDWRKVSYKNEKNGICSITPHYVLLTFADKHIPLPINKKEINVNNTIWHVVTYSEYAESLDKNQGSSNSFSNQLISNYSSFISAFYEVLNLPHNITNEFWSVVSSRTDLRSIRMDDIWQKLIANIICAKIAKSFTNVERDLNAKELAKYKIGTVCVNAGFSRGTAIIEVKKVVASGELHGIQIQNSQYRYLVERPVGIVSDSDITNFITNNGFTPTSGICGYGNNFKYQYKVINDNKYIGEIIKEILAEVQNFK